MLAALGRWGFIFLKYTLYLISGVSASLLVALYMNQNKLIYPSMVPEGSRTQVSKPSDFGLNDFQDLDLQAEDGVNLKAYFIKQSPIAKTTLVYYHANAGNMGHRLPIAKLLYQKLGCNVLMLSYRGYGLSEGEASETGLKRDAQAALDFVTGHDQLKGGKIILYGQSIGGAVAIDIASRNQGKIDALIVENTFTTLKDTIQSVFGHLGFIKYLCHQKWNSVEAIKKIDSIPILFLSGKRDELVKPWMMQELFRVAESSSKQIHQFEEFDDGSHNDTCIQAGYFEAIALFWKKCSIGKGHRLGS